MANEESTDTQTPGSKPDIDNNDYSTPSSGANTEGSNDDRSNNRQNSSNNNRSNRGNQHRAQYQSNGKVIAMTSV